MAFNTKKRVYSGYDNPESLFRDRRNRQVQGLLSHQSDILRLYKDEAYNHRDIAIELPTGSGKTLVGLLIAEYRRSTKGERALYLCPTNQLVQQVCRQSLDKYGINATPFVGSASGYSQSSKAAFLSADTVAVSTYSALFNTNPFFSNPQLIIIDDAHAAEGYIASNWSLDISRSEENRIYEHLVGIIVQHMPTLEMKRFQESNQSRYNWIEIFPGHLQHEAMAEICSFLDENIDRDSKLLYSWSFLRSHLHACQVYIGFTSILIRPLIPPTLTHAPFANAVQRVYMSATLGLTGDLERIIGVPDFCRLPIPQGWDKQGVGRRLFIFPELSLKSDEVESLVQALANQAGRALVLTPDRQRVDKWNSIFKEFPRFSARDIESTSESFIASSSGIAILANRYEGLDFLDNDCRLLILDGLPKAANLQETFQMTRMMGGNLFKDRIRTRIVQAVGRCTRSATDYAAIVIIGEDFYDWLVLKDKQCLFHPELQGELQFGIQQKEVASIQEFLENLDIFLRHDTEWNEIDSSILEMRDEATQAAIPGQDSLFASAKLEVDYTYSLWNSDYTRAAQLAESIADSLSGDDLKGLRGQWYYQAAICMDRLLHESRDQIFLKKTIDFYQRASACLPALSWLRSRIQDLTSTTVPLPIESESRIYLEVILERLENVFETRRYASSRKFERDMRLIIEGVQSDDSDTFEEAHRLLGEVLGFRSENSSGHATPDPWWIVSDELCIVFEDKSDSKPENAISVTHTRQAASHPKWIRENIKLRSDAVIHASILTTQKKIHPDVSTYAEDLGYWHVDDFRRFANESIEVLRTCRSRYTGIGESSWREFVRNQFLVHSLDPLSVIDRATRTRLRDVEIS